MTPDGHPDEPEYCEKLCSAVSDRYMWTGSPSNTGEAEAAARRVLRVVPDGHPGRWRFLARPRPFHRHQVPGHPAVR